ncbi:hypothetical protein IWQ62_000464 [Dispira parvispora]|uniref:Pre-rRNA-processing protein RIX1 n=1 Tax=Dispira parvispora TaxID=1520584 RepID=A0A9W8E607_9FUNG|nr:hypothetical protein IWQ62_000464 [Dispira parvispora]
MATPTLSPGPLTQRLVQMLLSQYLTNEKTLSVHVPQILATLEQYECIRHLTQISPAPPNGLVSKWFNRLCSLLQSKAESVSWSGILLLQATVRQTSLTYLSEHLVKWGNLVLGLLNRPLPVHNLTAAVETLSLIVKRTVNHPQMQRDLVTNILPKYNQALLRLVADRGDLTEPVLVAMTASITAYPNAYRPMVEKTFQRCIVFLGGEYSATSPTVIRASECLAALCGTGSRSPQTNLPHGVSVVAEHWRQYCLQLVGSIHETLDQLLETVDEPYADKYRDTTLPLSSVSPDYLAAYPRLLSRIQALACALVTLLNTHVGVPVRMPVPLLLAMVSRLAWVNVQQITLQDHGDKAAFSVVEALCPEFQLLAIKVLTGLMTSTAPHLQLHLPNLGSLFTTLLTGTASSPALLQCTYVLVNMSLSQYGSGLVRVLPSWFFKRLGQDLATNSNSSSVDIPEQSVATGKRHSKKRRTETYTADQLTAQMSSTTLLWTPVQLNAVQTATRVFSMAGQTIPASFFTAVTQEVLSQLVQSQLNETMDETNLPLIQALYECLLAIVQTPFDDRASVLPHALRLFQTAMLSSQLPIRQLGQRALTVCDHFMHPRLPALAHPPVFLTKASIDEAQHEEYDTAPSPMETSAPSVTETTPVLPEAIAESTMARKSYSSTSPVGGTQTVSNEAANSFKSVELMEDDVAAPSLPPHTHNTEATPSHTESTKISTSQLAPESSTHGIPLVEDPSDVESLPDIVDESSDDE